MRAPTVAFLVCVLPLAWSEGQESDLYLSPVVFELASALPARSAVALGTFVLDGERVGSPFSLFLERALVSVIHGQGRLAPLARKRLDEALAGSDLDLTELAAQRAAAPPGRMGGAQALLSGVFSDAGAEVAILLELVDLERAALLGRGRATLPRTVIPVWAALEPCDLAAAAASRKTLAAGAQRGGTVLGLHAWCTRGDGGVYRPGERIAIGVQVDRGCQVVVTLLGGAGGHEVLYRGALRGGEVTRLGLEASARCGVRYVHVAAAAEGLAAEAFFGFTVAEGE